MLWERVASLRKEVAELHSILSSLVEDDEECAAALADSTFGRDETCESHLSPFVEVLEQEAYLNKKYSAQLALHSSAAAQFPTARRVASFQLSQEEELFQAKNISTTSRSSRVVNRLAAADQMQHSLASLIGAPPSTRRDPQAPFLEHLRAQLLLTYIAHAADHFDRLPAHSVTHVSDRMSSILGQSMESIGAPQPSGMSVSRLTDASQLLHGQAPINEHLEVRSHKSRASSGSRGSNAQPLPAHLASNQPSPHDVSEQSNSNPSVNKSHSTSSDRTPKGFQGRGNVRFAGESSPTADRSNHSTLPADQSGHLEENLSSDVGTRIPHNSDVGCQTMESPPPPKPRKKSGGLFSCFRDDSV